MGTARSETTDVQRRQSGPFHVSSAPLCQKVHFEHCTSCYPSSDATMVALTKKKSRLPLHGKDLLTVGTNVGGEMFSHGRSLAAHCESTSQQTTKRPPVGPHPPPPPPAEGSAWNGCFDDRPAWPPWPRSDRGNHSAVRGWPMNFRDLSWWPPLFFPTQNG